MDTTQLLPLLIQVPLVGAFMWFVLELNKRQDNSQTKRDGEWREFLKEERTRRSENTIRMVDEMKEIAKLVAATNTLVAQHDVWERIEIEKRFPR